MKNLRSDESAELGTRGLSRVGELEVLANGSLLGVLEGDGWERLDVEVGALRARLDELSGEGEDGTRFKSDIESSGDRLGTGGDTDESLVTGLDGDNGSRGGKDIGRVDKRGGTQVGGDTDSLEDTRSLDHGVGARESSVKVVVAGLDGLCASAGNGRLESGYVGGLGLANHHKTLDLGLAETKGHEVAHGELGETHAVEF